MVKMSLKQKCKIWQLRLFLQYEEVLEKSNRRIKTNESFIGGDKIKNDVKNTGFKDNMKEKISSEKDEVYRNNAKNWFNNLSEKNKHELILCKKLEQVKLIIKIEFSFYLKSVIFCTSGIGKMLQLLTQLFFLFSIFLLGKTFAMFSFFSR